MMIYKRKNSYHEEWQEALQDSLISLTALVKWLLLGCIVGVVAGGVGSLFAHALRWATALRGDYPWIVLGLPLGGLLIVFLYRITKNENDRGTNGVIESIHSSVGIPFRVAPLIFISTVITHLFGASAGREGAALQLGGSISGKLGSLLGMSENDKHLLIMCGMSAGFSALFGTPLAAAVFSMEVVSVGIMHYAALVPCVAAALVAKFMAQLLAVPPEVFPVSCGEADPWSLLRIALLAAAAGLLSTVFCLMMHHCGRYIKLSFSNPYVRIAVWGSAVAIVNFILYQYGSGIYMGSGMEIIEDIFHTGSAAALPVFLLKMLFTAVALAAGFKGGEIVPSLAIGASFGSVLALLLGLPVELAAACGMVGLFCGVTNSPVTSLLLAFELFGFAAMPYYLVTVAVSYMISGRYGLYRAQRLMYSKTETKFINTTTK